MIPTGITDQRIESNSEWSRFLNSLPMTDDSVVWASVFRESLQSLLGDVDRIIVTVITTLDLTNPRPERERNSTVIRESLEAASARSLIRKSNVKKWKDREHWEQLLSEAETNGVELSRYREPVGFTFYYREKAVCGSLILLRYKENRPISSASLRFIEEHRLFFTYIFTDQIARAQSARPAGAEFREVLNRVDTRTLLSDREQDVLLLQLIGLSYRETAERLHVSENTVKAHLRAVYRKTGCTSIKDVFARYFTFSRQLS